MTEALSTSNRKQGVENTFGAAGNSCDSGVGILGKTEISPGLMEAFSTPGVRAVSFDVFDTVLTRYVGHPPVIFLQVGQLLKSRNIITETPDAFFRLRHLAETRARRNFRGREVSLREIYREMTFSSNLEERLDDLMAAELEIEAANIYAVPSSRSMISAARRQFGRVLYISDMYLPEDFIKEQLRECELLEPGDMVYVSSTYGCWKGDGRLYRKVLEQERLQANGLLHCGNSHSVDVVKAREIGIHTYFLGDSNPITSESILNEQALQSGGVTALIAGASRKIRLQGSHLTGPERVVWETGAAVTGPLVLMYARWVIDRASEKGIKHLFFLARDAYLIFRAVEEIIASDREINLELHYIYGSRGTYLALDIEFLGEAEWERLVGSSSQGNSTIQALCSALAAERKTFQAHLSELGFTVDDWSRPLRSEEMEQIKVYALENVDFNRALVRDLGHFRATTVEYLKSHGLGKPGGGALVDTGWTTNSHYPLFKLIQEMSESQIRIFYIGIHTDAPRIPIENVDTFLFSRPESLGPIEGNFLYARPVETLLMAGHGRTVGFERRDGKVVPVLSDSENPKFIALYFSIYERAVLEMVRLGRDVVTDSAPVKDFRGVFECIVRRFWIDPTPDEAAFWGRMIWEADSHGNTAFSLAKPYTYSDAWSAFKAQAYPSCHAQFWIGGAKAMTPKGPRRFIEIAIFARRMLGRAARKLPTPVSNVVRGLLRRLLKFMD